MLGYCPNLFRASKYVRFAALCLIIIAAAFLDLAFMPGHVLALLWSSIIHWPILLIKVLAAAFVEIWFVAVYRDLMKSSLAPLIDSLVRTPASKFHILVHPEA